MEILYRGEGFTAAQVREHMASPPSYSAVRAQLRILEEKGHIRHEQVGQRYIFYPIIPREHAGRSALSSLVETFFKGSAEAVVAALIDGSTDKLNDAELERMAQLIERARQEGR